MMQIQIYKKDTSELVAWLYVDCDEDRLVDAVMEKNYDIKVGKNLTVKEK